MEQMSSTSDDDTTAIRGESEERIEGVSIAKKVSEEKLETVVRQRERDELGLRGKELRVEMMSLNEPRRDSGRLSKADGGRASRMSRRRY